MSASTKTIAELMRGTREEGPFEGELHAQIESVAAKNTRDGKPYLQVALADATGQWTLRVWSDHRQFRECSALAAGAFVSVRGAFVGGAYGLEADRGWRLRTLTEDERRALLEGSEEDRRARERDSAEVEATVAGLADPRLTALCGLFLEEHGERFRRAAAARHYHHARRGGLLEHTAQMLRAARALVSVYPTLNADLLFAGVLFHDAGKLWETQYPDGGFAMAHDEWGELIGHIVIGCELINRLWHRLLTRPEADAWHTLQPPSEDVRMHLLHLICSHHGEPEFGSPVVPKTPEAFALHHIDNLDAKLEMTRAAYGSAERLAPRILERVRPLPGNLVEALPPFDTPER